MLYTSQLTQQKNNATEIPGQFSREVVEAAQRIYRTYYILHGQLAQNPSGVAVDAKTHRGQLLFTKAPILLPGECFIPVDQLESED